MAKVSVTVRSWFSKANDNLIGARSLWSTNHPRVRLLVGFHCQQAVEMALKGFLLFNGKRVQKLHSIDELSTGAVELAPELTQLLRDAAELTPYAVELRYPSAKTAEVADEDILRALQLAEKTLAELSSRIPFDAFWDV